ncbi:MAG: fatty acid desaturase [Xanthomonadaceae bacterium]|nr:fatty acid desaturase [Xanthomonadaceae bacterium]
MPQLNSLQLQKNKPLSLRRNESFLIPIVTVSTTYALILGIVLVAERSGLLYLQLLALPLIAALQNHLQILQHEGAHYQIHPKRKWNDITTNITCTIPFGGLISHYRHFHFLHHRFLLDPKRDPEISFYAEQGYDFEKKPARQWAWILLKDFSGYHYFQFFFSYNFYLTKEIQAGKLPRVKLSEILAILFVFMFLLTLFISGFGGIILFYWILPQPTFMFLFLKLQGYGEHSQRQATIEESTPLHSLTGIRGLLIRFFIYPLNSDLHKAHHLNLSVPWHRLRQLEFEVDTLGLKFDKT